jgi:hypothetical protein
MDSYKPFQTFILPAIMTFGATRYEEYQNGQMIDSGMSTIVVRLSPLEGGRIGCIIGYNNLTDKLMSCSFDACITLHDRLLMINNPCVTNAHIPVTEMLSSLVGHTREQHDFLPIEPVVGSIYTEHGDIAKLSFTMSNPERLIELFN